MMAVACVMKGLRGGGSPDLSAAQPPRLQGQCPSGPASSQVHLLGAALNEFDTGATDPHLILLADAILPGRSVRKELIPGGVALPCLLAHVPESGKPPIRSILIDIPQQEPGV